MNSLSCRYCGRSANGEVPGSLALPRRRFGRFTAGVSASFGSVEATDADVFATDIRPPEAASSMHWTATGRVCCYMSDTVACTEAYDAATRWIDEMGHNTVLAALCASCDTIGAC